MSEFLQRRADETELEFKDEDQIHKEKKEDYMNKFRDIQQRIQESK